MNIKKLLLLCISALCFSAVVAKTSSQKVETDIPTSWNNLDTLFVQQDIDQKWWLGFGDATLNSLVDICIANNYNLAEAAYRVDAAKASMRKAEGGYYPSINISAAYDEWPTEFSL